MCSEQLLSSIIAQRGQYEQNALPYPREGRKIENELLWGDNGYLTGYLRKIAAILDEFT